MRFHAFKEISQLVARHANDEGANATAVDSLLVGRHTSRSASIHCPQSPIFGMVVQGRMSIELGGQVQHYGVGDYLFVSFDVPGIAELKDDVGMSKSSLHHHFKAIADRFACASFAGSGTTLGGLR